MFKYINKLLEELSHNMLWTTKTLVTNKLINISNNTNKFQKTSGKLPNLFRRTQQDIQTAVEFLMTNDTDHRIQSTIVSGQLLCCSFTHETPHWHNYENRQRTYLYIHMQTRT